MKYSDPIAALEIGTSRTVIAIGERLDGGRIRVAAVGSIPSAGVKKSQIIDIAQVRYSIESVIKHLSEQCDYMIGQAYLVVSGPQIRTKPVSGHILLDEGIVGEEDIEAVDANTEDNINLTQDRTPIELAKNYYQLDDECGITSPKDLSGRILRLHSLCIHGSTQHINNARKAAHDARLEIIPSAYFFSGTCAAAAVLTPQHKKEGSLVIDLGGGSTAYTAWADDRLLAADVIGVGGDHVSNDIHEAFSITHAQAEQIKITAAHAMIRAEDATERVAVPESTPGFKGATISRRALNTVVNARLQELFTIIRTKLDDAGILHNLNGGIFLTGGGAALPGIEELATSVFGHPVRVATLLPEIEGLENDPHPAACAVYAGLLLLAQQQVNPTDSLLDLIKKSFGFSHKK